MKSSEHGIPILPLDHKVDALLYCLTHENCEEDAMGHLFDLIHHMAPHWKFGDNNCTQTFNGIQELANHYGAHPTPPMNTKPIEEISQYIADKYKFKQFFKVISAQEDYNSPYHGAHSFVLAEGAEEPGVDGAMMLINDSPLALFPEVLVWNDTIWRPRTGVKLCCGPAVYGTACAHLVIMDTF